MSELLYEPVNSIIMQSYAAKEMEEPLNGDGFGVGWYVPEIDDEPAVFTSVTPAWNNRNLKHISKKVRSGCILAHVRAASEGVVAESNCHPFQYQQYLMMHNGGIPDFGKVKKEIVARLDNEMYLWIHGQTDSEYFFALFLQRLQKMSKSPGTDDIARAMEMTFGEVLGLMNSNGISEPAYFNMVVSDGSVSVGSRFVSDDSLEPLTLHHSEKAKFVCEAGKPILVQGDESEHSVILASEVLTDCADDWHKVPAQHFVIVEEDLEVRLRKVQV